MCHLSDPPEALIPVDVLHPPILTLLHCTAPIRFSEPPDDQLLDFPRINFEGLREALLSVDWSPVYNASDVNEAVQFFNATLTQLFPRFVPVRRPRMSPPWTNRRLRYLKQQRSRTLRLYSNNRNSATKQRFIEASTKYKFYNRALYGRYVMRMQKTLKTQPKRFWAFVNEKRKEHGLPSSMFLGCGTSSNM